MREHRLLVFPAWEDNPYVNLLNLAARATGYRHIGATTYRSLVRRLEELGAGDVLQLHWTQAICQTAASEPEAHRRLASFKRTLSRAHDRGAKLVWTVHNKLPHELNFRNVEIDLLRFLAAQADGIHVMSPMTVAYMADICALPQERVHYVPHPSYLGVYGPPTTEESRADARAFFGIAPNEYAVLAFGQMRGYKGLDILAQAAGSLAEAGVPIKLMLAGSAKANMRTVIEDLLPEHVSVVKDFHFIEDADVHRWFDAADVAVFPYRAILNSGSTHLAATFGVPVILPGEKHLQSQYAKEKWVRFYDPAIGSASLAAVLGDRRPRNEYDAQMNEFTTSYSPWHISQRYRDILTVLARDDGARTGAHQPTRNVNEALA